MSSNAWFEPLTTSAVDGAVLTAAAAASCIPTANIFALPGNFFDKPGKLLRLRASGRISCAVTTPGTGRFDVRFGATVVWDSGAFALNTAGKTNVPWAFELNLQCRTVGNATQSNLLGLAKFTSEAVIGAPLPAAGGQSTFLLPVGNPTLGNGFDATTTNLVNFFFTQTVATGSLTCTYYELMSPN